MDVIGYYMYLYYFHMFVMAKRSLSKGYKRHKQLDLITTLTRDLKFPGKSLRKIILQAVIIMVIIIYIIMIAGG